MSTATITEAQPQLGVEHPAKLRIGVVLDGPLVPLWIHRVLEVIEGSDSAELALIVRLGRNGSDASLVELPGAEVPSLLRLWGRIDHWWFKDRCAQPNAFELTEFSPLNGAKVLDCWHSAEEQTLPAQAVREAIARTHVDLMLNLASTAVGTGSEEWMKTGVWSFDREAELWLKLFAVLQGQEDGFNDIIHVSKPGQSPRPTGTAYWAADRTSLFRSYSTVCWRRSDVIRRELTNSAHQIPSEHTANQGAASRPSNLSVVPALARVSAHAVQEHIRKRYFREDWFIAFRKTAGDDDFQASTPWTVLKPPRDRFYADPFVIDRDGKTFIFFENYSYVTGKAVISFVEIDAAGHCSQPDLALEEPCHLAYPSVFEWEGETYLLPETKNNRTVQLYRAVEFPRRWELDCVLLDQVSACDSTLLRHSGKWWLFTSGLGTADPWFDGDSELFLFFALGLHGPWTPHPANPVVTDVRNSRSAGNFFFLHDQLIRPAQDCCQCYGYAVSLNHVHMLSTSRYEECRVGSIFPGWFRGNRGTHTYNRSHTYEVVDGRTLIGRWQRSRLSPQLEAVSPQTPLVQWD